ncbi:hypothetical protein DEO72_LG5g2333 [Vigna unguiculata]|uniref:PB1-like domain-containing protein n=1 Tax=Vigna unguiculata TaxID=3917 RepID=A0A4D6M074_VIGUN|nr:hypothetical protein DEO72_LG5g2333 [Vigna unguiculata]
MGFSIAFYHMGKFEAFKGRFLRYKGGEEHVVHGLDADRWSYFEALSILKDEFKYDGMVKLWWKLKRGRMDRDLRPLVTDKDALDLSGYAESRKEEVQIYVEHVVSTAEPIEFIEAVVVDDKGGQDEAVVVDDNGGQDEATANDNGGHGGAATAAVNDNGGHGGAAAAVNDNGGHGGAAVDAHGQAESNVAAVDDGNVAAAAVDDGNVVAAEHEASCRERGFRVVLESSGKGCCRRAFRPLSRGEDEVEEMGFSIAFYHMGKFEAFKGRFLRYKGGEEHVVHGLDADRWSYFEALSILKDEFKYDGMVKLWWKLKRGRMDRDLRPLGKGHQKKSNAGSESTPSASAARRSNKFRSTTGSTSQPPTTRGGRRPNKGVAATVVLGSQASSSNPS